jgi:hypothetical protein
MKITIPLDEASAEQFLPGKQLDGSGVGVNYADAYLKTIKITLPDGRKVTCRRRGLKLTLSVGERTGEGLLRRLQHGPDVKVILREALVEAARNAGATLEFGPGVVILDPDISSQP